MFARFFHPAKAARRLASTAVSNLEYFIIGAKPATLREMIRRRQIPPGTEAQKMTGRQIDGYKDGFHWHDMPDCLVFKADATKAALVEGLDSIYKMLDGKIEPCLAHYNGGFEREALSAEFKEDAPITTSRLVCLR